MEALGRRSRKTKRSPARRRRGRAREPADARAQPAAVCAARAVHDQGSELEQASVLPFHLVGSSAIPSSCHSTFEVELLALRDLLGPHSPGANRREPRHARTASPCSEFAHATAARASKAFAAAPASTPSRAGTDHEPQPWATPSKSACRAACGRLVLISVSAVAAARPRRLQRARLLPADFASPHTSEHLERGRLGEEELVGDLARVPCRSSVDSSAMASESTPSSMSGQSSSRCATSTFASRARSARIRAGSRSSRAHGRRVHRRRAGSPPAGPAPRAAGLVHAWRISRVPCSNAPAPLARDLARRRLGHGARAQQAHVRRGDAVLVRDRRTHRVGGARERGPGRRAARRLGLEFGPHLGDKHERFAVGRDRRERRDAARPQRVRGGALGGALDVLRIMVAAAHDEQVLEPPAHKELAAMHEAEVARAQVSCAARGGGARHDRGAARRRAWRAASRADPRRGRTTRPCGCRRPRRRPPAARRSRRATGARGPSSRGPWTASAPRSRRRGRHRRARRSRRRR